MAYHGGGFDWERLLELAVPLPNLYVEYASSWPLENPVRAAVDRLKTLAEDPAVSERDAARTALRILYFEHVAGGS